MFIKRNAFFKFFLLFVLLSSIFFIIPTNVYAEDNEYDNIDDIDLINSIDNNDYVLNYRSHDYNYELIPYEKPKSKRLFNSSNGEPWKDISKFDLRNVNGKNYVSPVKNQNPFGACWAFGTFAAAESNYLKTHPDKNSIYLSEYNLVGYTFNNFGYADPLGLVTEDGCGVFDSKTDNRVIGITSIFENTSGSYFASLGAISSGIGLVNDNVNHPYVLFANEYNKFKNYQKFDFAPFAVNGQYFLGADNCYDHDYVLINSNMISFKSGDYANAINLIKKEVYQKGALAVTMYFSGDAVLGTFDTLYYNYFTNAYYYNDHKYPNHAVSIIGWDDTFSKSNFNNNESIAGDGAWLVRNSWGPDWGDGGYFWMSYYDQTLLIEPAFTFEMDDANQTKIYQYDSIPTYDFYNSNTYRSLIAGQIFTPQNNESINSIMFLTGNNNVTCDVEIYTNFDMNIFDSQLINYELKNFIMNNEPKATASATFDYAGYHSVFFNDPAFVKKDEPYLILLKIKSSTENEGSIGYVDNLTNLAYGSYNLKMFNTSNGKWFIGNYFEGGQYEIDRLPNTFMFGKDLSTNLTTDICIKSYATNVENVGKYVVNHYFQNIDATGYDLDDSKTTTTTVNAGTVIKASDKKLNVNGFVFDQTQDSSITVEFGETKVVNVYYNRVKKSLIFNTNGGNTINKQEYLFGQTISKPNDPTRNGYIFDKWNPSIPSTMPYEDLTVNAIWNPITYNFSYDYKSGTKGTKAPSNTKYDVETVIDNPTRLGYAFTGWNISDMDDTTHVIGGSNKTDKTLSGITATKFKNLTAVNNATIKFIANWKANKYNLSFDLKEGVLEDQPSSADYDSEIIIGTPTKEGYSFAGWTISGMDDTTHIIGESTKTSKTLSGITATKFKNLTAINNATVTFTANWGAEKVKVVINHIVQNTDGTGYEIKDTETKTDTFESNQSVKFESLAKTNTQYPYFTFKGGIAGTSSTTTYPQSFNTSFNVLSDGSSVVNLFYTRNKYDLIIQYDSGISSVSVNGTNYSNKLSKFYNQEITLKATTKTGYSFNKWTLNSSDIANANTDTYKFNMPFEETTFKALSSANTYNISYTLNGGTSGTNKPTSGTYDSNVTIDNPTRLGYTFAGWTISGMDQTTHIIGTSSKTDKTLSKVTATSFKNLTSVKGATVTFTANWEAITYNISYDLKDGTLENYPTNAKYDQEITIDNPTKIGFSFAGWTISDMDETSHVIGGVTKKNKTLNNVMATKFKNLTSVKGASVKFTANWNMMNYHYSYDIYLMNKDGSYGVDPYKTIEKDGPFNSTINYLNEADEDSAYNHFTIDDENSDLSPVLDVDNKVIKIYYKRNKYNINIIDNNNAASSIIGAGKYYYEQQVSISVNIKPGYKFSRWEIDNNISFDQKTFNYTIGGSDVDISLITNPITYNVEYIIGEGSSIDESRLIKKPKYDQEFIIPYPSKTGQVFLGWKIDGLDDSEHVFNNTHSNLTSINKINVSKCMNLTTIENATVTFTALWEEGIEISYNILYYYQDINGNYSDTPNDTITQNCVQNSPFDLEIPSINGFTFDEDSSDQIYGITFVNNDCDVTVKYKRNKYHINLSKDSGIKTISSVNDYKYFESEVELSAVANDGFSFKAWEKDNQFYSNNSTITITVGLENNYKATSVASSYNIVYELDEGTIIKSAPTSIKYGETFTVPHPTKKGYDFVGWYVDNMSLAGVHFLNGNQFEGTSYTEGNPIKGLTSTQFKNLNATNNETVRFIAIWTESLNSKYTIEHYLMNNNDTYDNKPFKTENLTGKTNETINAEPIDITGYVYVQSSTNVGTIKADGSLCIKLYYERKKYTIVFDGNGETSGKNNDMFVCFNSYVEMPSNGFKKTNASFMGWQIENEVENIKCEGDNQFYINESFINNHHIDNTITIKAIWKDETVYETVPGNIVYGQVKNLTNKNSNEFKTDIKNDNIKDVLYSKGSDTHSAVTWVKAKECPNIYVSQMSSALKSKNISFKEIYCVDIDLYMADYDQPNVAVRLSDLNNSIKLSLDINEYPELLSSISTNKIVVYSIHDGKLQNPLDIEYDNNNKQILFNTDKFSVYALCVLNEPSNIKSSDNGNTDSNTGNNNPQNGNSEYKIPPTGIH